MGLSRQPRIFLRPLRVAAAGALAITAALAASAALAGPRVGEIVGRPSTVASTVHAKVISATPVIGQVTVPRRECFDELRQEPPRANGAGALLGAIAGGAVGNAVGKGGGRALATGLGIFGGAILGDHIQKDGRRGEMRTVRRCEDQPAFENRVVAYNVVYEYGGQRYTTQMPREPGRTIPVQVTLAPAVHDRDARYPEAGDEDWDGRYEREDGEEGEYDEEDTAPVYHHPPRHPRSWY